MEELWESLKNYAEAATRGAWIGDVDTMCFYNPSKIVRMEIKEYSESLEALFS